MAAGAGQWRAVGRGRPARRPSARGGEHHKLRNAVAYALAAFEEIPKFIPAGEDAVPESAFTSEAGRARYRREPRKFERGILEMNVRRARAVLAGIDEVGGRPGGASSGR
ncbi:hypothetical protein OG802_18995 [Streptomyces sp. NBC_00704]|uniref:hypothetical protein n=1 Tax=Streptomyces sp. NBC_00704 TaxID=2975809 RepID=UPI002E35D801|nr:hypothetical protein [Streptomyces sp. NBC_00704]